MEKQNQNTQILTCLKNGIPLTALSALKYFGCFRLSARIYDLKKRGVNIGTKIIYNGNRHFAQYRIKH